MTEYDWPEGATHVLVRVANYQQEYAWYDKGKYYDKDGDMFCLHSQAWCIHATRPEPQIKQCCGNFCDKGLLEKELKLQGAKEFLECCKPFALPNESWLLTRYAAHLEE